MSSDQANKLLSYDGEYLNHYANHVHQQRCRTGGESWGTKITQVCPLTLEPKGDTARSLKQGNQWPQNGTGVPIFL